MNKEFELEPGEALVLEVRKHWFLFVLELLPYVILAVLPLVLPAFFLRIPQSSFTFNLAAPIAHALYGAWLLMIWTAAWGAFTKYFLNAWVLTSQRIVNIKQRRFFSRVVSSLFLSRVQDVTTDVDGVLSSLLGIGDIKVQTAAEEIEFVMRGIPNPESMRDLILKYVPEEKPVGV